MYVVAVRRHGGPATGTSYLRAVPRLPGGGVPSVARQLWDAGRWTCLLSFFYCSAVYQDLVSFKACFCYAFDAVPACTALMVLLAVGLRAVAICAAYGICDTVSAAARLL